MAVRVRTVKLKKKKKDWGFFFPFLGRYLDDCFLLYGYYKVTNRGGKKNWDLEILKFLMECVWREGEDESRNFKRGGGYIFDCLLFIKLQSQEIQRFKYFKFICAGEDKKGKGNGNFKKRKEFRWK